MARSSFEYNRSRSSMKIYTHIIVIVIILSFSIFIYLFFSSFVWNFLFSRCGQIWIAVNILWMNEKWLCAGLWLCYTQAHDSNIRWFAFTIYFWRAGNLFHMLSCSPYTIPLNKYIFSFRLGVVARGNCIRNGWMRVKGGGYRDYFYQRKVNLFFR